ncbi:e3 ubiquitin-protein ligase trim33-like [Anaeramoeba ignava]|uniref:E3 ubiquitin-protein ligase trim33-like n=1 Tax=Anaeramoeba ignava TaxID=1746090 RepID=A0A9Q0LD60_ANAIG|nr:e3 ubiquitin-protein ligase trim33-like [Anaeramoeba ignava]
MNQEKKVIENLIEDYSNLLNENSFTDFSIFVENEPNPFEIKVHKSILSSRSPFFNVLLKEKKKETNSISLKQFNKKEMESILSYIYYGNISFENQENLFQLLEISIYFKLNLLKEIIQKKISNSINYSNFFQFLFQNRNLKLNEIEIKCFELINQNFSQIQNNENLFNLTKEEIIKFIQFKQEKKEIFQFDFFQFLNNWIEKRNEGLIGTNFQKRIIEKKRQFHSFFSLFDKDSISKQDFDKLKQFDFFPKSFLINLHCTIFQRQEKEIEEKFPDSIEIKEILLEEKWKKEIEKTEKKIKEKNKENQELKSKYQKMKLEIEKMKPVFDRYDKYFAEMKQSFPQFADSEIIREIEYIKKLREWINDNDFFSKMKKGFSAKTNGFDCRNWHKYVDNQGKTLIIIKTKDNFIFGGFTQIGFTTDKSQWNEDYRNKDFGYIIDPDAFIFSLRNDKNDREAKKFSIKTGQEPNSIYYNFSSHGPIFGGGGDFFLISNLQPGWSNFGYSYNLPDGITYQTDESKSYLAGSYNSWVVDELETYFI